jgi:hypothetical protein
MEPGARAGYHEVFTSHGITSLEFNVGVLLPSEEEMQNKNQ